MQKIITKREKVILFTTIAVVIFSIGFNFLFFPLFTRNDNLNKEIKLARAKLKKYLWLLSQKEQIQGGYSEILNESKGSVHREDTLVAVLSELEDTAKKSDIRIIDIRPQAPQASGSYKEIIIEVRAEGTMENYLKFIYSVENSLSVLRIKKIQLNAKANSASLEGIFSISQLSALE